MKHTINPRTAIRSIMALFVPSKTVNAHERYGDVYYRNIYFTKQIYSGIEQVAALERKSKKKVANELMERGLRSYWGEMLGKYIEDEQAGRVLARNPEITRFVRAYRSLAKDRGYDISKFI